MTTYEAVLYGGTVFIVGSAVILELLLRRFCPLAPEQEEARRRAIESSALVNPAFLRRRKASHVSPAIVVSSALGATAEASR